MKKENSAQMPEDGQEPKHRYHLNKKKLAKFIAVLCLVAAGVVIAFHFLGTVKIKEVIAAIVPPQEVTASAVKESKAPALKRLDGKIIVVDAGHGGEDPGASGASGSVECDLNIQVALALKKQFESKGAKVVMTRKDSNAIAPTKDEDWDVRQDIISQSGADLLVSIHMNWFEDSSVSGPIVLFLPGSDGGRNLADAIQDSLNDELDPKVPGKIRSEDLIILKDGSQPSVLVECGYISNPDEEAKLKTEEYQEKVAGAILDGALSYFSQNE